MQGIADAINDLRAMGYIIGLSHSGNVKVRFPCSNQPEEGKRALEYLRSNREDTKTYLRDVFMPQRKEEMLGIINDLLGEEYPYPYDVANDPDLHIAVGQRVTVMIYHTAEEARARYNGMSKTALADLQLAATYDPQGLRSVFDAMRAFEGKLVEEEDE